jgi:hypothetical protein
MAEEEIDYEALSEEAARRAEEARQARREIEDAG